MEYWRGRMDWPLNPKWVCEICGENGGLTWGLVHSQCRCNVCHVEYYMRNAAGNAVDIPILDLQDGYVRGAQEIWSETHMKLSEWNESEWESALARSH